MTRNDKIQLVNKLYGDTEVSDELISVYLDIAMSRILHKRNPYATEELTEDDFEPRYDYLQCEIAVFLLAKRGAEGQVAHKENGIDRVWGNWGIDVPIPLLNQVVPKGKVIG